MYTEHYNKISTLRYNFEKILERLKSEKDFETKSELALYGASYFVYNNCGYFTSSVLENFFADWAKNIKVNLSNIQYKKNSFLHVLTEGYETGGHTRVVERWIENAPANQVHSVIQIKPSKSKLLMLSDIIKAKNGNFILLKNNLSIEEKAIKLRKIAMEYEYVILHTHMGDPTAILAFGTEEFTRPVLFYNHASHMPWLGKNIADLVLDIVNNDAITKEKRGITNTYFLGVPTKNTAFAKVSDKNEIRRRLKIPFDKKIIVTSGSDARYRNICGNDFRDYLEEIMDDNTLCYVIGVKPKSPSWKKIKHDTKNRVITLGFINFHKGFSDYLKAADLYLDSYPLGGGTAMIDAISSGVPALSLNTVCPQFDYLTETSAYCQTKDEFINKARKVLNNKAYANEIYEEVKNSLIKYQSTEAWNKKIEKLFEIAPKNHKVKILSEADDYCENNDLSVLCNAITNKKFLVTKKYKSFTDSFITNLIKNGCLYKKQGIPFIFELLTYKKGENKIKIFKLFSVTIFKMSKSKYKNRCNAV